MTYINIILGILLIHYISLFFFKGRHSILSCGIFGHCTNSPKKVNQANVRILGLYNEDRGKNSCGITYDGEIYHGVESESLFKNFIKGRNFDNKVFPIMFGHTRQSSVGVISRHNAHPFGFGENKRGDGHKLIGVHNGTLLNYKEIAEKYEIELGDSYIDNKGNKCFRTKIDSEILFESIFKSRTLKVLSEYNGRAALAWTDTDQPNVMYLFSGKSKPWHHSDEDKAEEERPLNVYIQNKNSFYFSSIPEALYAIGGDVDTVFQIEYNTVFIITDGNFKAAKQIRVSRKKNYHLESYLNSSVGYDYPRKINRQNSAFNHTPVDVSGYDYGQYQDDEDEINFLGGRREGAVPSPTKVINLPSSEYRTITKKKDEKAFSNIYHDTPLKKQSEYGERIYVQRFRYCRNGHNITGIYCDVPGWGLHYLGDTVKGAKEAFDRRVDVEFVDGCFDMLGKKPGQGTIPFTTLSKSPKLYYFLDGIMMKHEIDYTVLLGDTVRIKNAHSMSYCAVHPVINLSKAATDDKNQGIYKDGNLFTGEVDGLYFEKIYLCKGGNLVNIVEKQTNPSIVDAYFKKNVEPMTRCTVTEAANARPETVPSLMEQTLTRNRTTTALTTPFKDAAFSPAVFNSSKNFILDMERKLAEDELLGNKIKEQEQMNKADLEEEESAAEDQTEIVGGIINEHFTPALINFQDCLVALKAHKNHPDAKEGMRVINQLMDIVTEYLVPN